MCTFQYIVECYATVNIFFSDDNVQLHAYSKSRGLHLFTLFCITT